MKLKLQQFTSGWNVNDWIVAYLIFISTFYVKLAPIGIVALMLSVLFKHKTWDETRIILFDFRKPGIWMILFYVYHFVGMLWSTNSAFGWADIGMKASFLLIPVLFAWGKFTLSWSKALTLLTISLVITVIYLLGWAAFKSIYHQENNRWAYFFESEFSAFMHRSYFATYCVLGAVVSFVFYWQGRAKKWYAFAFVLLSIATVLTMSKAGIILLLLAFVCLIVWLIISKKQWLFGIISLVGSVGMVLFLVFSNSGVASRLKETSKALSNISTTNNPSTESNAARIIMWSTARKVIANHWFLGAGTGDVKDELIAKNWELNNTGVAESKLNAHNQYLNTWVQLGFVGFILLIGIFISQLIQAWKSKQLLLSLFVLIFSLSFAVESFVETQAGIVPFCILTLVFFGLKQEKA